MNFFTFSTLDFLFSFCKEDKKNTINVGNKLVNNPNQLNPPVNIVVIKFNTIKAVKVDKNGLLLIHPKTIFVLLDVIIISPK
ncbi:MAG: hypothetical protein EO766_11860 [Hydrotalea sp. AMD]|uniref:hypothetical protein n=1 Tax=Hydrotalea sp. AMD TaxID=2501297 RepID=UPI001027DD7F|nr:hypothetical protein [Hydrotalea sp. AMD]RWZ87217.1 MAG: hypothetical protein EO766_11860 [Hydrotalea sp. AMD]